VTAFKYSYKCLRVDHDGYNEVYINPEGKKIKLDVHNTYNASSKELKRSTKVPRYV